MKGDVTQPALFMTVRGCPSLPLFKGREGARDRRDPQFAVRSSKFRKPRTSVLEPSRLASLAYSALLAYVSVFLLRHKCGPLKFKRTDIVFPQPVTWLVSPAGR